MFGGIDLNKPRLCHVAEAVIALSALPAGFTASALANQVRAFGEQSPSAYDPRQAVQSEEIARQRCRPADRLEASLRGNAIRSAGNHRPAHAPRESHQAAACGRSGRQPQPQRTKPTTDVSAKTERWALHIFACIAGRLTRACDIRVEINCIQLETDRSNRLHLRRLR
jgi:hypothetical protein